MKDTFLFVSEESDFAPTLLAALEAAGKIVIRAGGVAASLQTMQRWAIDSVLVDPALSDDPAIGQLAAAASSMGADFWVLDAARVLQITGDISSGP